MALKYYKPTTPGRRLATQDAYKDVSKKRPEKQLLKIIKGKGGRTKGKISVRHRGGGNKRFYRIIDFKQDRFDEPVKVTAIEYDPNRSCRIALIQYPDGEKRYIIAVQDIKVGDELIFSQNKVEIKSGNRTRLENIPVGTIVSNIELYPKEGGLLVRSAGMGAYLMAIEGHFAQLKLPSGEIRLIPKESLATIGPISNPDYRLIRWGKAGRKRWQGIRPTVRGKAMNPREHPHGGGEGKSPIGLKHPKTLWGKPALGVKTRKKEKKSNRLIIKRRK